MKDERLEKEFEEYFKGVNISDDITADAKKSVGAKRKIMPKIVKFASIAASIVLVFAVSLAVILKTDFNRAQVNGSMSSSGHAPDKDSDNADAPGSTAPDLPGDGEASAPTPPQGDKPSGGGAVGFELYTDSDLVQNDANAYSVSSLNSSLKFIEKFALADNASVNTCKASYMGGKLVLVKTEVSISNGLNRDETTIYVEFTKEKLVYSKLTEYYEGKISYYYGAEYYLTRTTTENGEPEFKLHILYNGVKYYFNVHSSDQRAYQKYLDLIIK